MDGKEMKKVLSLLAVLALSVSVMTGCGGNRQPAAAETTVQPTEAPAKQPKQPKQKHRRRKQPDR